MPQDLPGSISPLAPFEGSFEVPGVGLSRRWLDARDLTPALRDEALDVIDVAFNHDPSWYQLPVAPRDHFEWKYRDRPTGVTIRLTLDGSGRVVGFVGTTRRVWWLQGRPFVASAGYDLCRLPQWQGRGLRQALEPFRGRDWHPSEDFSFEYFGHPADRAAALSRGERAPANETHDYLRVLRVSPLRVLHALFTRAIRLLPFPRHRAHAPGDSDLSNTARVHNGRVHNGRERSKWRRLAEYLRWGRRAAASLLARRRPPASEAWAIATIGHFEDRHALFINRALAQFEFYGERPVSYLNWRFCDDRAGPFTVRLATRLGTDNEVLGYAVTRVHRGEAFLVDILALPGELTVAETLIRDAIALAKSGGTATIRTRLPQHHPYGPALRRSGFFDLGHRAGELIAPRDTAPEDLAFLNLEDARIHHVLADSDHV